MDGTPCTEHAQKQMLQNIVSHSSISQSLIQNNISLLVKFNQFLQTKIDQFKAPFDSPTQQASLGASDSSDLGGAAARGLETRGTFNKFTSINLLYLVNLPTN